jgi:hypothetical protein
MMFETPLDADLADDLRRVIAHSESALEALDQKLHALGLG